MHIAGQNPAGACAQFRPLVDEDQNLACHLACIARTSSLEVVTLECCLSSFIMEPWKVSMDSVYSVVWDTGFIYGGCSRISKAVNGAEVRHIFLDVLSIGKVVAQEGNLKCARAEVSTQNPFQMCLAGLQRLAHPAISAAICLGFPLKAVTCKPCSGNTPKK